MEVLNKVLFRLINITRFKICSKQRGSGAVSGAFMIVIVLIVFLAICESVGIYFTTSMVQKNLQSAVLAHVTENYQEIFSGTKKQSASAFTFNEITNEFELNIDEGDILTILENQMRIERVGESLISNGLKISNLTLKLQSAPRNVDDFGVFKTKITIDISIKYRTVFKTFPPYQRKLTTIAKYIKKF